MRRLKAFVRAAVLWRRICVSAQERRHVELNRSLFQMGIFSIGEQSSSLPARMRRRSLSSPSGSRNSRETIWHSRVGEFGGIPSRRKCGTMVGSQNTLSSVLVLVPEQLPAKRCLRPIQFTAYDAGTVNFFRVFRAFRGLTSLVLRMRFHKYHALGNDYIVMDPARFSRTGPPRPPNRSAPSAIANSATAPTPSSGARSRPPAPSTGCASSTPTAPRPRSPATACAFSPVTSTTRRRSPPRPSRWTPPAAWWTS